MSTSTPSHAMPQNASATETGRSALWMRGLRALTGLYILAYVTLHLLNLGLGLISLEAMEAARPYLSTFWTGAALGPVLMLALLTHYVLGLWAIYERPRITGTAQDLVQALSGLLVIPLMATHVVATNRLKAAGVDMDYETINRVFWLSNPGIGLTQVLLVSVVWVHGCAGFFSWLRAKPQAVSWLPWLYPLGVAIPVLALLGYTQAGRLVLAEGLGPVYVQQPLPDGSAPPPIPYSSIVQMVNMTLWGSAAISILVLSARALRLWLSKPARILLATVGVGRFEAVTGQTLLDAFRTEGQPHANLCAGRGRCGTCAVRILSGAQNVSPVGAVEQSTLERVDHGPGVRLACQLHLEKAGTLEVARVLPPDYAFGAPQTEAPDPPTPEVIMPEAQT